ncbi:unnamed protein product [Prorocentrum cordatum]|uniref:Uncharacterized protein n=1 Tax=Prorocentrum cordatum TaxID=2364126 RepID=A0ABN9X9E3_9DINO|nr:unnamed protein product [Polarella glacialis]
MSLRMDIYEDNPSLPGFVWCTAYNLARCRWRQRLGRTTEAYCLAECWAFVDHLEDDSPVFLTFDRYYHVSRVAHAHVEQVRFESLQLVIGADQECRSSLSLFMQHCDRLFEVEGDAPLVDCGLHRYLITWDAQGRGLRRASTQGNGKPEDTVVTLQKIPPKIERGRDGAEGPKPPKPKKPKKPKPLPGGGEAGPVDAAGDGAAVGGDEVPGMSDDELSRALELAMDLTWEQEVQGGDADDDDGADETVAQAAQLDWAGKDEEAARKNELGKIFKAIDATDDAASPSGPSGPAVDPAAIDELIEAGLHGEETEVEATLQHVTLGGVGDPDPPPDIPDTTQEPKPMNIDGPSFVDLDTDAKTVLVCWRDSFHLGMDLTSEVASEGVRCMELGQDEQDEACMSLIAYNDPHTGDHTDFVQWVRDEKWEGRIASLDDQNRVITVVGANVRKQDFTGRAVVHPGIGIKMQRAKKAPGVYLSKEREVMPAKWVRLRDMWRTAQTMQAVSVSTGPADNTATVLQCARAVRVHRGRRQAFTLRSASPCIARRLRSSGARISAHG